MSAWLRSVFTLCECRRESASEGRKPSETGVVGRGTGLGDLSSGSGRDDELRRASRACIPTMCDAGLGGGPGSAGVRGMEPDPAPEEAGRVTTCLGGDRSGLPEGVLPSEALAERLASLPLLV